MKIVVVLFLILVVAKSDLTQCIKDIVHTVPTLTDVIKALVDKKFDKDGIIELIKEIEGLSHTCDLRICLEHATQRCESENPQGCEQYGEIIYPKCKTGYQSVGCCVCNAICPSGFKDEGAFCAKPSSYGRGAGYPWKFGDKAFNYDGAKKRCEQAHGVGNCQQNGLIYYPKCAQNFHNVGCCVCSPNCPSGWNDIGVSCDKPSYGRGAGYPFKFGDCKDIPKQYPLDMTADQLVQMSQLQHILEDVNTLINNQDYDRANLLYERAQYMMNEILPTI